MWGMVTPLQYGDPPHVGPFALQARLQTAPAGLVYLGQAPDGRVVSVAVLSSGAALDAAARDRFVTAIKDAQRSAVSQAQSSAASQAQSSAVRQAQGRTGVRGWGASLVDRVRGRVPPDTPPVLAMQGGPAPWVAVPYMPNGPGAERFLDPVTVSGTLIGQRHGPDFAHYWLGDRTPALPAPPAPPPPPVATRRSVVLASTLLATLVLALLLVVWMLLFRGEDEPEPPRPLPNTQFVPTPPPEPASPEPQQPTPGPSGGGGDGSESPWPDDLFDGRGPI
ncbi:hypothetical protein GCM10027612_53070 [Microbispora bryophytorum subsp. camponoti]|uniref:Uncharacterized protein n=2 Tax=Microbispora bryophytorum TaxID=1460882 RepID=A0ABR8KYJ1_9ACTN|nr:hypothetical protein [Microbispora camponoti]